MSNCSDCQGLIMENNRSYCYSGKVCNCPKYFIPSGVDINTDDIYNTPGMIIYHNPPEPKLITNTLKIKIKKLIESAIIPTYSKPGDAGLDLTATSVEYDPETDSYTYGTGLAFEVPNDHFMMLVPRSSISKKHLFLSNSCGIVDSGYRGEVKFVFKNNKDKQYPNIYKVGDRIGQLIIMPFPRIEFEEVSELSNSERGQGGFGSSGI